MSKDFRRGTSTDQSAYSGKINPLMTVVRQGVPYEEILKYQSENNFDLIVIASHGRSGIAKYLMGSVATKVVNGAKCEVLVLK
jgi:nucleotide-binding universal stress UspA family protein